MEKYLAILKQLYAREATDEELKIFLMIANHLGLDPVRRHIVFIKRIIKKGDEEISVPSYSISIDGLRAIAQKNPLFKGVTAPYWCGDDGKWVDVWMKDVPPIAAKVGVYRSDFVEPIWGIAYYKAHVQMIFDKHKGIERPTLVWQKMPEEMLAKCAEALALRRAFSIDNDIESIIDNSFIELPKIEAEVPDPISHEIPINNQLPENITPSKTVDPITSAQKSLIMKRLNDASLGNDFIVWASGKTIDSLTKREASSLLSAWNDLTRDYLSQMQMKYSAENA